MLRIRLRRMGNRHRAFFRIVVSDSRKAPTSSALEELGYYDPKKHPAVVKVNLDHYDAWVQQGAQASATVRKLVASARQDGEAPAAPAPVTESAPAKEIVEDPTPTEEVEAGAAEAATESAPAESAEATSA